MIIRFNSSSSALSCLRWLCICHGAARSGGSRSHLGAGLSPGHSHLNRHVDPPAGRRRAPRPRPAVRAPPPRALRRRRQAEIGACSKISAQQRRRGGTAACARRPAMWRSTRPAGGAAQGLEAHAARPSRGCRTPRPHRRNLRDGRPRPAAAAGSRAYRRPDAYVCGGPPAMGVAIGGAAQPPPASRSHDARMEERHELNRHEGRTRAIVEGWAAERARRVRSLGSIRQRFGALDGGQQRRLEEKTQRLPRAARRKAEAGGATAAHWTN